VSKTFNQKEKVLKEVDLSITANTFTAILGPSGSGKTTLLNVLSGLLKPTSGKVLFKEHVMTKMSESELSKLKRNNIGNILQNYLLLSSLTVEENIMIELAPNKLPLPFDELVDVLGISDILDKFPSRLSGGQQQRVAIARAVIKKPDVLFCDEATGSLDEENSKAVIELLHEIKQLYGVTILFTTHNLGIADTADRVLTIKDGQIFNDEWNEKSIPAYEMVWG
jgi:putative ABC transport system ATP-binding protein